MTGIVAIALLCGFSQASDSERVDIKWRPRVGQYIEYVCQFGFWHGTTGWAFVVMEFEITTTVLAASKDEVEMQLCQRASRSWLDGHLEKRDPSEVEAEFVDRTTTDLFGYPKRGLLTFPMSPGIMSLYQAEGVLVYPKAKVRVGETWARGGDSFTYAGKDKVNHTECFRISLDAHEKASAERQPSSYWLDVRDGSIVKLQIGEPKLTGTYKANGTPVGNDGFLILTQK